MKYEWKKLDINNLPPDILVYGNYDFKSEYGIAVDIFTPDNSTKEYLRSIVLRCDADNCITIFYRKHWQEKTAEQLSEEYANSKTCYKTPIKEAFIAGYKSATIQQEKSR